MAELGYVYFIYIPDTYKTYNYFKIGRTKHLDKRLSALQTGNPFQLVIYKHIYSKEYKNIETELHRMYKDKKIKNEWFKLTIAEIDDIVDEYVAANDTSLANGISTAYRQSMGNLLSYIYDKIHSVITRS